jgi:hypothetical protein
VLHLRQSEPNFLVATRSFADLRLQEWGEWEDEDLQEDELEDGEFQDSEDEGESLPLQHAALQQHNSSSALAAAVAAAAGSDTSSSVNGTMASAAVPGLAAVRTARQHSSRSSRCASSGSSAAGGRRTLVACAVAAFRISGCPTVQHSEYQVRAYTYTLQYCSSCFQFSVWVVCRRMLHLRSLQSAVASSAIQAALHVSELITYKISVQCLLLLLTLGALCLYSYSMVSRSALANCSTASRAYTTGSTDCKWHH